LSLLSHQHLSSSSLSLTFPSLTMRFATVFAIAGAVASVSASALSSRQIPGVPECAQPCLLNPNAPFGNCDPTDNVCLCNNQEFVAYGTQCVTDACTEPADREAAFAFSRGICSAVGVELTSTPATGEETAAASESAPAATGSATTEGAPAVSSAVSAASSAASSVASVVRPTGSGSGTVVRPTSSRASASASASGEPADQGSASTTRASIIAVAAMGLAAFAL
jgi:hypothetical protein